MATETVEINITGNSKGLQNATKQATINLREMGEKVSNLGMRLSAAFTLPVLAIGRWVLQNEELKKSLEPIGAELTKVRDDFAKELLPVVRELMPVIMEGVRAIGGLVRAFGELTTEQKINTLQWIGFVAAIGPVITIIGQVIGTIGTVQTIITGLGAALPATSAALSTFGASAAAALGPVGALAIAVSTLLALLNSDFGKRGIVAGKQLIALAAGGLGDLVGGKEYGNRVRQNAPGILGFANGGSFTVGGRGGVDSTPVSFMATPGERVTVSPPGRGGGGMTVIIQAQTLVGDADGIRRAVEPALNQWARSKGLV